MYEVLESGDCTGKKEYSIYDNGEYICTTLDKETAEKIKKALEKQTAKKPRYNSYEHLYPCPNCSKFLITYNENRNFSTCCGQLLDWN